MVTVKAVDRDDDRSRRTQACRRPRRSPTPARRSPQPPRRSPPPLRTHPIRGGQADQGPPLGAADGAMAIVVLGAAALILPTRKKRADHANRGAGGQPPLGPNARWCWPASAARRCCSHPCEAGITMLRTSASRLPAQRQTRSSPSRQKRDRCRKPRHPRKASQVKPRSGCHPPRPTPSPASASTEDGGAARIRHALRTRSRKTGAAAEVLAGPVREGTSEPHTPPSPKNRPLQMTV